MFLVMASADFCSATRRLRIWVPEVCAQTDHVISAALIAASVEMRTDAMY